MFPCERLGGALKDLFGGGVDVRQFPCEVEDEDSDVDRLQCLPEEVAQKNRPTTARKVPGSATFGSSERNAAAPWIPRLYQARCLRISLIPCSPWRRNISSPWRRIRARRASGVGKEGKGSGPSGQAGRAISRFRPAKIHGFPMAARPIITLSQPV